MANLLSGAEELVGADGVSGTALDFWRWAFSDIRNNTLRGIFAEWLVARLLNIPTKKRSDWDSYDLQTPDGIKIEVKASAYLQSWHSNHTLSKIKFSRLKTSTWDSEKGHRANQSYNADIYIFCLQTETNPEKWDAFDISQWKFYILTKYEIKNIDQASISLSTLRKNSQEQDWSSLQESVKINFQSIS